MIWTHIYDLLLKLATIFLSIVVLIQIPWLEENPIVLALLGVLLFFVVYNYFVRTLATYLYCKFTLKMNVDLTQAKELNDAFSPLFTSPLKWLPMKELKNADDAVKYQVAIDTYNKWREERKRLKTQQIQNFKNAGQRTKTLTIVMYGLVGYFMIAGFMNWPPANYIAEAYCRLFETENYFPIFNCAILILPTILLFRAYDRNIL